MNRLSFIRNILALGGAAFLRGGAIQTYQKFYLLQCFVAGFRFHPGMEHLEAMREGDLLELVREPENPFDDSAIALYWKGIKIGFIPKAENEVLSRLLDARALELVGEITHLNPEVKPWENLHIGVYFLKAWKGELPEGIRYLSEQVTPHYRTLNQSGESLTRITARDVQDGESEKDWYGFFVRHFPTDRIYDILHHADLDPAYAYGAETDDYLLVNLEELNPDVLAGWAIGAVDEWETTLHERAGELEALFGERGYVVLSTEEAEGLVSRVEELVEVVDKLGNRYIEMVLK